MSSAVEDKLSNYVKLLSAPIPESYFLIMRKSEIFGVYISCKGMVTFPMTEIRLNARFKTKSDRRWSNFRFYWTKICTRVILDILQSSPFLHFLKAKYINNYLK